MIDSICHCLEQRSQYLSRTKDWDWILHDPVVSCFTPALFLLDEAGYIRLSDQLRKTSYGIYLKNTAFWLRRESQLRPVLELFEAGGIAVIPLKGAGLLDILYKKIGLRLMTDIDLLVRPGDFVVAAKILLDSGMQPKWYDASGELFTFMSSPPEFWPGELSFYDGQKLHIDLHRDLVTYHWFKVPYPVDMDGVWQRSIQTNDQSAVGFGSQKLPWMVRLSPYDMLAHLCLHLAMSGLQPLKNFLDVDLWLRYLPKDWDWGEYFQIVKNWQIKSVSYHVFSFCQRFFDTPLPEYVMRALAPSDFDQWQVEQLISPEAILSERSTLGKRYPTLVKYALFDNSKIKVRTIWNLIFPGRVWLQNNPPTRTVFQHWSHILHVLLRGD